MCSWWSWGLDREKGTSETVEEMIRGEYLRFYYAGGIKFLKIRFFLSSQILVGYALMFFVIPSWGCVIWPVIRVIQINPTTLSFHAPKGNV